jgi:hypothetical protein
MKAGLRGIGALLTCRAAAALVACSHPAARVMRDAATAFAVIALTDNQQTASQVASAAKH